jgi:hypothetical protein
MWRCFTFLLFILPLAITSSSQPADSTDTNYESLSFSFLTDCEHNPKLCSPPTPHPSPREAHPKFRKPTSRPTDMPDSPEVLAEQERINRYVSHSIQKFMIAPSRPHLCHSDDGGIRWLSDGNIYLYSYYDWRSDSVSLSLCLYLCTCLSVSNIWVLVFVALLIRAVNVIKTARSSLLLFFLSTLS